MSEINSQKNEVLECTSRIVASYLSGNTVAVNEIPQIMDVVHQKVSSLSIAIGSGVGDKSPAVPIEESITPDHIICLEDGKAFKMLKKHLKTKYNLSPEEYRAKWRLPLDYPMVAPNYAMKRQELARASGLGKNRS